MVLDMRISLYLYSTSIENSIRFYVDELSMFSVVEDFGTGYCLLRATDCHAFHIYVTDWVARPSDQFTFSLDVRDCDAVFRRLRDVDYASGARIIPDATGNVEVFEYPGGKNFEMEDPDGNRFLIYEHYGAG